MKKFVIPIVIVLILGGAGAAYAYDKHQDKVAKQEQARAARALAQKHYQEDLAEWKTKLADWTEKQDAYEACKSTIEPLFAALDSMEGKVTGGVSYDEYSDELGALGTDYQTVARTIGKAGLDCTFIGIDAESAYNEYAEAGSIWMEWFNDEYDTRDLEDLPLQRHWTKATNLINKSNRKLDKMQPSAPEPVKPTEPTI